MVLFISAVRGGLNKKAEISLNLSTESDMHVYIHILLVCAHVAGMLHTACHPIDNFTLLVGLIGPII